MRSSPPHHRANTRCVGHFIKMTLPQNTNSSPRSLCDPCALIFPRNNHPQFPWRTWRLGGSIFTSAHKVEPVERRKLATESLARRRTHPAAEEVTGICLNCHKNVTKCHFALRPLSTISITSLVAEERCHPVCNGIFPKNNPSRVRSWRIFALPARPYITPYRGCHGLRPGHAAAAACCCHLGCAGIDLQPLCLAASIRPAARAGSRKISCTGSIPRLRPRALRLPAATTSPSRTAMAAR